ncbi:Cap-gly domain-containing linker protein 2, partial [Globisporangium splendens]
MSDQVRQAYRKLALQFHPDKNSDPSATETFQRLSAAYKRICDHHSRCAAGKSKGSSFTGFMDSDDGDLLDEDDDMLDEMMDLSHEDMLMMFQVMFGGAQALHRRSKPEKKMPTKANAKSPQVRAPRRGGRGNNSRRRVPGRGGFGHSPFFHSAEEMMLESFTMMGMGMDLSDLEKDLESMSSFFESSLGEDLSSDFSSVSSDEDEMGDHDTLFQANGKNNFSMSSREKASSAVEAKQTGRASDTQNSEEQSENAQAESNGVELNTHVRVFGKHPGVRLPLLHDKEWPRIRCYKLTAVVVWLVYCAPQVVRFRGPVHYAKGDFIGVCLNEPLGKNDGTIKGVSYFSCPPQCGLMVRSEDVAVVA